MKKWFLLIPVVLFLNISTNAQVLAPLGHGVRTSGTIDAMVYDSVTGYTYAGGYFENIGGIETNGIAMYNGSQWVTMAGGLPNGYVSAICIIGSDVYVGGSFELPGGIKNIARWDGTQWHAVGTSPVTYYTVMSLAEWNGELLLSAFLAAPAGPGGGIAKWDGSNWSAVAVSQSTNLMIKLYVSEDTLYAWGRFEDLGGVIAHNAAMIPPGGGVLPLSVPVNTYYLETFIKYKNNLYTFDIQGMLMHYDSVSGWIADSLVFNDDNPNLFIYRDSLHFAGTKAGNPSNWDTIEVWNIHNITKYNRIGYGVINSHYYEGVHCTMEKGNELFIGGNMSSFDKRVILNTARYNGSAWYQFAGTALVYGDAWKNAGVSSMLYDSTSGQLYVGGSFLYAGDSIVPNVARWDGSQWHAMGDGFNWGVNKLIKFQDTIYACGGFSRTGLDTVYRVAKWNGSDWIAVGQGAPGGTVYDMIVFNGSLYAGGTFTSFNGISADRCIKYNGTTWSTVGSNDLDGTVYGFVIYNGELCVYGSYFGLNWPNTSDIAKLSGSSWVPSYNFPDDINSLHVYNNDLYASTSGFTTQWTDQVYKYTNGSWVDFGFQNNGNSGASLFTMQNKLSLTAWNDRTYQYDGTAWHVLFDDLQIADVVELGNSQFILGGFFPSYFDGINTINLYNIGSITLAPPISTFTQDGDTICDHQYIQFTAASANVPVSYEWQFPGGIPSTSTDQFPIVKYNVPGSYDVILKTTNNYGSDSLTMSNAVTVLNCSLGIPENDAITISVFPNPARDLVTIQHQEPFSTITIQDLSGKVVMFDEGNGTNSYVMDIGSLPRGVYMLKVESEKGFSVEKLVVAHP